MAGGMEGVEPQRHNYCLRATSNLALHSLGLDVAHRIAGSCRWPAYSGLGSIGHECVVGRVAYRS
jgi:hypothetical protein